MHERKRSRARQKDLNRGNALLAGGGQTGPLERMSTALRLSRDTFSANGAGRSTDVRVGVCGFCVPQSELFRRFALLEVQQTFYWPPQLRTAERWRRTAPADFEFTVKAFQAITHPYNNRTYRKARFSADELAQCGDFCDTPVVREA